jgi:hypothetical protein
MKIPLPVFEFYASMPIYESMKWDEAKRDRKHQKREHFMLGAYLSIYGRSQQ